MGERATGILTKVGGCCEGKRGWGREAWGKVKGGPPIYAKQLKRSGRE